MPDRMFDMSFIDRADAGRRLAERLGRFRHARPVILALPRGGVPVAAEVSAALDAPLDLVIARKVGVPFQPELAMGAIAEDGDPVRNEYVIRTAEITDDEFARACARERLEIARRRRRYLGERPPTPLAGRTAIIIDDGIATGATMRAALVAVRRRKPDKIVLAVPVAPASALEDLRDAADEIVCLETPEYFGAIGLFYRDFGQVEDQSVVDILARCRSDAPAARAR
jgi:putative phosphoribosyl transferase